AGQESWLEGTALDQGQLTFWWKLSGSAATPADALEFWMGQDLKMRITGQADWGQATFVVPAGAAVRWRYKKNSSVVGSQNAAWLDQLTFVHWDAIAPVILQQLTNQLVFEGDPATWQVIADGTRPLSYRWYGPAGPMPDMTNNIIAIAHSAPSDQGIYYVR